MHHILTPAKSDDDFYSECLLCRRSALTVTQFEQKLQADAQHLELFKVTWETPEVHRWSTRALEGATRASHGCCPWCAPAMFAQSLGVSIEEALAAAPRPLSPVPPIHQLPGEFTAGGQQESNCAVSPEGGV